MVVSKTLRFEIFKRDEFVCRYCGNRPPRVILEVDHVIPVSKAGTDEPENLVTTCRDCNRGEKDNSLNAKSFIALTEDRIKEEQERLEQKQASEEWLSEKTKHREKIYKRLRKHWVDILGFDGKEFDRWRRNINWYIDPLASQEIMDAIEIIGEKKDTFHSPNNAIRYFFGICKNKVGVFPKNKREKPEPVQKDEDVEKDIKENYILKPEIHKFGDIVGVITNLEKEGMSENEAKEIGNILDDYFTFSFLEELDEYMHLSNSDTPFYEELKSSLHFILNEQKVEKIDIDFLNKDFPDRRKSSLKDLNVFLYKLYNTMIPFFYYKSRTHLGRFIFLRKSHYDIFVTFLNKFTISIENKKENILEYIQSTKSGLYFRPELLGLIFAAVIVEFKSIFADHGLSTNNEMIRKLLKYYERDDLLECFKYIDEPSNEIDELGEVRVVEWNKFLKYLAHVANPQYEVILLEGNCQEFKSIFNGHENILKDFFAEDKIIKLKRSGEDRRSGVDRRKFNDPNYKGPERRSGRDRRSGKERRKSV
jgi:hypothetical protein